MGRGKLPMKLIEKERARRITCMKRKKGLIKKAYELSTLCDVRVCLIIYDSAESEVKTWPEQPHQVEQIVADYLAHKAKNPSAKRDLNISDFFNDRIKKLKQQNEKLLKHANIDNHNINDQSAFPVWDDRINEFSEDELFDLLARLDAKLDAINKLKADRSAIQFVTPHNKAWLDQPSSSNEAGFLNGFDQTTPFDLNACYHGLGFTVPNSFASMAGNINDEIVANNLMIQPYEALPVQDTLSSGIGQSSYVANMNMHMMIGGGLFSIKSDHKFRPSTSANIYYDNMDIGYGKAPAV